MKNSMTNSHYKLTPGFMKACEQAAQIIDPANPELPSKLSTTRQASKFRRGTGLVWKTINNMIQQTN
jgi:hypothetical protein